MRIRLLLAFTLSCTLNFGGSQLWVVNAWGHGEEAAAAQSTKKKGNSFLRALKSPFRGLAKLFGGGDKNRKEAAAPGEAPPAEAQPVEAQPVVKEEARAEPLPKIERMTESDQMKFVSLATVRVLDSLPAEMPAASPPAATAQERLERGRAHLQNGANSAAIAALSSAVSLDAGLVEAHNLLGVAYDRKGLRELARQSYRQALSLAPRDPQILNNLGYSLYLAGHYREAIGVLKQALKNAPGAAPILNNLALAQCRAGRCGDAFQSFRRAGGEFLGHLNVAKLLERFGRTKDAVAHFERARRLEPKSVIALERLAVLYRQLGCSDEAEEARQALTEISREHAAARTRGL